MTPEFSRPVPLERLAEAITVEATPEECTEIARRLQIPAVASLWCRFGLHRRGAVVEAVGDLRAAVVQSCVVSLERVSQEVFDTFALEFVPAGSEAADDDLESPDQIAYEGGRVDFGEAAVQQLALALDPYPRAADEVLEADVQEDGANPFADLASLRRPA